LTQGNLQIHEVSISKQNGSSPADDRFYVTVLFDISDAKKYRKIIKVLNGFSDRIQYSIFEAYLKKEQIRNLTNAIKDIMASPTFFDANDRIRIYKIAGNCELTVFGEYVSSIPEDNVVI
jgi:CRISPR-associated endonuclease Cas2